MILSDLTLRANFILELRERGKLVHRLERHNIELNIGRDWIVSCLGEVDYGTYPLTHPRRFIRYMGMGIGSYKQGYDLSTAYPALDAYYPGTNVQTDVDPNVESLERPIAIRDSGGTRYWAEEVSFVPGSSPPYIYADFNVHFSEDDFCVLSDAAFAEVPISEAMLMLSDQDPTADPYAGGGVTRQLGVFYLAFAVLSKTNQMTMDITWRIRA